MDKNAREALAQRVVSFSRADDTEVVVFSDALALTRFTHQSVHQNVASQSVTVRVRAIVEDRTGVATTTVIDEQALHDVVERAATIATYAPRETDRAPLPGGDAEVLAPPAGAFVEATADAPADLRARFAEQIFAISEAQEIWSAGFASTGATGVTIANSRGVLRSFDATEALVTVKQTGEDSTGYGELAATGVGKVDGERPAMVAATKVIETSEPEAVAPGDWTVVLEPAAFGELLSYLADSFSAQAVAEGASFIDWETIGAKRFDASFTLRDDWTNPLAPGMPFDYEGVPRRAFPLVEAGVVRNVVTDSRWAHRLKRENTGHALPMPNGSGPQPLSLTVDAGTRTTEQLIASTERGLLISRFWYIRPVDQKRTIVTGMTRDGTYLILDGRLAGGVKNLRFNQSIVEALASAVFSDTAVRTTGYGYTVVVPAVKLAKFAFSSSTSF